MLYRRAYCNCQPLFNTAKIQGELGIRFIPLAETLEDMVKQMKELGIVKGKK